MALFLGKRLLLLFPVLFGILTLTFFLMHATPGDPARTYLGTHASPEALRALRHQWGLDKPLWGQYLTFLTQTVHGRFGKSIFYQDSIVNLVSARLPPTLLLMVMGTFFSVIVALPLAMLSAVRKNTLLDGVVRLFDAVVQGMPVFFISTVLVAVFALRLPIFPASGYAPSFPQNLWSLVLPSFALGLGIVPLLVRSLRASLISSLDAEYVVFARSKGLRRARVWMSYGLRNGSISGISILGIQAGFLAGGSLVVENVFAIPGMGSLLMTGILNRDFPVVQASTLVFAVLVVGIYLLTDLAYAALDPRVRQQ